MGAATEYFRHIKDAVLTVFDGMAVSASHLLRRPYTIQYPDRTPVRVQDTLPFRYRGILDVDLEICTGCLACERACPIDCIVIVCEKNAQTREIDHLAVRYRHRKVHVLRPVQRAVSDRLDPSYDRVRGRGILARKPDSPLRARAGGGVQAKKGPRDRPPGRPDLSCGRNYVDEYQVLASRSLVRGWNPPAQEATES